MESLFSNIPLQRKWTLKLPLQSDKQNTFKIDYDVTI